MTIRMPLVFFLSAAAVAYGADTPTFSIAAHVIANGSSAHAASSCFGLEATIAEPIAGFSSGGGYGLSAGFSNASPVITDTIFANAFEDCSP